MKTKSVRGTLLSTGAGRFELLSFIVIKFALKAHGLRLKVVDEREGRLYSATSRAT